MLLGRGLSAALPNIYAGTSGSETSAAPCLKERSFMSPMPRWHNTTRDGKAPWNLQMRTMLMVPLCRDDSRSACSQSIGRRCKRFPTKRLLSCRISRPRR